MPEDNTGPERHLTSSLEELDSLLEEQEDSLDPEQERRQLKSPAIPVLDDLVTASYPEDDDPDFDPQEDGNIRPYLSDLAERLEHKLSMELDEIVSILKGNLKESIMTELQTQMHEQTGQRNNEK